LARLTVTALGFGAAFAVNVVSYAVSAVALSGLAVPGSPEGLGRRLCGETRARARLLVGHGLLRALKGGQALAALSAGATSALLVALAEEHLGEDGGGYGLLIGAMGVGAALGPLLLLRLIRDPARPPVFVFAPLACAAWWTWGWPR
jgi:hypothetical protein